MSTTEARKALPEHLSYEDCIHNISRASMLVNCFATGQFDPLRYAMEDRLHQPYRTHMFPYDPIIKIAVEAGAHGAYLSGAGPTVLAITGGIGRANVGDDTMSHFLAESTAEAMIRAPPRTAAQRTATQRSAPQHPPRTHPAPVLHPCLLHRCLLPRCLLPCCLHLARARASRSSAPWVRRGERAWHQRHRAHRHALGGGHQVHGRLRLGGAPLDRVLRPLVLRQPEEAVAQVRWCPRRLSLRTDSRSNPPLAPLPRHPALFA